MRRRMGRRKGQMEAGSEGWSEEGMDGGRRGEEQRGGERRWGGKGRERGINTKVRRRRRAMRDEGGRRE
jgi:hypothetical protein